MLFVLVNITSACFALKLRNFLIIESSIIPVDAQLQRPARGSSAHHQRSLYNQSPSLYDRISTPGGGDEYLDLTNEAYESFFKDQKNAMDDVAAYKSDFIDRWSAEGRARSRADVDTLLAELLPWGIPNGGWSDTEDDGQKVSDHKGDSQFLSEEERRRCAVRPSSSQPARPNTPAGRCAGCATFLCFFTERQWGTQNPLDGNTWFVSFLHLS